MFFVSLKMSSKYLILFLTCLLIIDQLITVETKKKQKKRKNKKGIKKRVSKMVTKGVPIGDFTDDSISPNDCGKLGRVREARITFGQLVKNGEYPWMVSLHPNGGQSQFCGGTLLNDQWAITAAHCLFTHQLDTLFVRTGSIVRNNGTAVDVTKQIHFPSWENDSMFEYDIGLLKLKHPVEFNDRVKPICFPKDRNYLPLNKSLVTAGWGGTEIGPHPKQMQKMTSEITDSKKCQDLYKFKLVQEEIVNFCAFDALNKSHTCVADSGGPIFEIISGRAFLIGVAVAGINRQCKGDLPDLYINVMEYSDWIKKTIEENK